MSLRPRPVGSGKLLGIATSLTLLVVHPDFIGAMTIKNRSV